MAQILSPDLPRRLACSSQCAFYLRGQARIAVTHISHPGKEGHHLAATQGLLSSQPCTHTHTLFFFFLQTVPLSTGQQMTSLLRVTGARGREAGLVGGQGQSPTHASSYRIWVMGLANVLQ